VIAVLITPSCGSAKKIMDQIGIADTTGRPLTASAGGALPLTCTLKRGESLFPGWNLKRREDGSEKTGNAPRQTRSQL